MSSSPFLSLPAEIRNRIYGLCTPINAYTEEFKGLLLASRQLHYEYESEALNVMQQSLASIKQEWPHSPKLRFVSPTTFSNINRVTVQLPLSLYFSGSRSEEWSKHKSSSRTRLEVCLVSLYTLYLSKLTFTFYDDTTTFINWTPWVIPRGLLLDMLDPLIFPASWPQIGVGSTRTFELDYRDVHIRELAYSWNSSKVAHTSDLNSLVQADVETANYFLHTSRWFQHPKGLVHNWGRDSDSIWFDLSIPGKHGV